MENIKKAIYSQPGIRRTMKPLWSAWVLVAIGVVCGFFFFTLKQMSTGGSSALVGGMIVGGCSLVLVLCYYLFGDSRRPWHKELHEALEPTFAYYTRAMERQLAAALAAGDEAAVNAVKRSAKPELVLARYSDKAEQVFYSQLLRVEGKVWVPLTEIIVNDLRK